MDSNEIGPTIEQPLNTSSRVERHCTWCLRSVVVASLTDAAGSA